MLKCPKCGGEMRLDYDPNKGSEWFECKSCDFVESINTISLRCEKAEAELEAVKGRIERAIAFLQNTDCKEVYKITIIKLLKGGE